MVAAARLALSPQGFASSPFVSMIEQAVLAMFPAGAAPGRLDMVIAVFVIPTLACCAIAATLSMVSALRMAIGSRILGSSPPG
jgi:hypothetical protein